MKPLDEWTEEYVLNLPSGEDDRFDRKASQVLIDCSGGQGADKKRIDLSKDVSAFSNSGGGFLIFGADNSGLIDGGVSTQLKSNGTHDWLDSWLGDLVEPAVRGYRIREIKPVDGASKIKSGNAVYILFVPDSEDAPHQARDCKYYVRLNAHNLPARHKMIEDIRSRRRKPRLSVLGSIVPNHVQLGGRSQILIRIKNQAGSGTARAPRLVLSGFKGPFQISQWGVDGHGNNGFPRIPEPSGGQNGVYAADLNTVIYPGQEHNVTCIDYAGDWAKLPIQFAVGYELIAEGADPVLGTLELWFR